MIVPRKLREQIKVYQAAGFTPVEITQRAGSHFRVVFAQFPDHPQFLTSNQSCPRALKNNLARFRALTERKQ